MDLSKRRCGCGLILGVRESCAKCTAAQRARLHAGGVGHMEESWKAGVLYDSGQRAVDPATLPGTPEYERVYGVDAKYTRLIAACDARISRLVREQACLAKPESKLPAIGEVVSWSVAKADMQARPEARYHAKGCEWQRRWHLDDRLMVSRDGVSWREECVPIGLSHSIFEWVRVA
jgi:hypothetical protein